MDYAHLFDFIFQDKIGKGKGFIFFNPRLIDLIKTLRNLAVHFVEDKKHYINRETTLFVKSVILCILHELRI